jgi:hypothetical protein
MTFSCADNFASDACVTTWVCKLDRTNVSAGRRENARGTTQKTGDANDHLSPWNVNVRSIHSYV